MWYGHVTIRTPTDSHRERHCMIHSAIERAGVIHPDPSSGSGIEVEAATVERL